MILSVLFYETSCVKFGYWPSLDSMFKNKVGREFQIFESSLSNKIFICEFHVFYFIKFDIKISE